MDRKQRQRCKTDKHRDEVARAAEKLASMCISSHNAVKRSDVVLTNGRNEADEISPNGGDEGLKRKLNGHVAGSRTASSPGGTSPATSSQTNSCTKESSEKRIPTTLWSLDTLNTSHRSKRPKQHGEKTNRTQSSRHSTMRLRKFRKLVTTCQDEEVRQMLMVIRMEEGKAACCKFVNTKVEGEVALHVAIENNDVRILEQLLHCGATPTVFLDKINGYPLFTAAQRPGCFDVLQQLISLDHDNLQFCDKDGFRVLEHALLVHRKKSSGNFKNNNKTISFLINEMESHGLLKPCLNRKTTLHIAAETQDADVFARLLSTPNVTNFIDYQDVNGNTPAHLICAAHNMEESDQLLMLNELRMRGAQSIRNKNGLLPHELAQSHVIVSAAQMLRCGNALFSPSTSPSVRSPTTTALSHHPQTAQLAAAHSTPFKKPLDLNLNNSLTRSVNQEVTPQPQLYAEDVETLTRKRWRNVGLDSMPKAVSVSGMSINSSSSYVISPICDKLCTSPNDFFQHTPTECTQMPMEATVGASNFNINDSNQMGTSEQLLPSASDVFTGAFGPLSGISHTPVQVSPFSTSSASASDNDYDFEAALDVIKDDAQNLACTLEN